MLCVCACEEINSIMNDNSSIIHWFHLIIMCQHKLHIILTLCTVISWILAIIGQQVYIIGHTSTNRKLHRHSATLLQDCSGGIWYLVYQKWCLYTHGFLLTPEAIKPPSEINQSSNKCIYFQTPLSSLMLVSERFQCRQDPPRPLHFTSVFIVV